MAGLAVLTVVGNLGADPETRITPNGKTVVSFSVAVSRKDRNGEERTAWYEVSCWGVLADRADDLAQKGWLGKGRQVAVSGRLEPRPYTDKNGRERLSLDVTANEFELVGGKPVNGGPLEPLEIPGRGDASVEDIPF